MGSGFAKQKKQARALQDKLMEMQNQMKDFVAEGSAGNGLVTLTLTGEGAMKSVKIHPSCVDKDDIEGLQDLIVAAHDDAMRKVQQATPGASMPDLSSFGLPF